MPAPRSIRRLAAFALTVVTAACAAEAVSVPAAIPLESQTWAPALQVTLSQFTKLPSGVYYLDSLAGTGTTISGTPTVAVLYAGFLPNGTKFDERAGTPICFPLSGLIEGWKVGMQGMKVGGKRRLLIPSSLGYGSSANGPIPANSNLLFNLTLQGVNCTP